MRQQERTGPKAARTDEQSVAPERQIVQHGNTPAWPTWAQKILAIAQSGLAYTTNPYEVERYKELQRLGHEILSAYSDQPVERVADFLSKDSGYATPKVDIRGIVFRDNKILLVQERSDGRWCPPGGWADVGESPSEMVVREVREESGFIVRPVKLIALYDKKCHPHPPSPFYIYKILLQCELIGGEPAASIETAAAAFFAEDELPPLQMDRITADQIAECFRHLRDPARPTAFD